MPEFTQYFMEEACFTPEVRIGCVRIDGADQLPLSMANFSAKSGCISVSLDGATGRPKVFDSCVSIMMFQFPEGLAEFEKNVEWFGSDRKSRAKLPEGIKFDETILAVRDAPADWAHDAYPHSSRKFVHIYRGAKQAVLIRWIALTGSILDHALFTPLSNGLRIVPGQWVTAPPEIHSATGEGGERITAAPLSDDVCIEIEESAARAREMLQLGRVRSPDKIVQAIHDAIDDLRKKKATRKKKEQFAIDCGALFGQAFCQAIGWQWRRLTLANGEEVSAVCSPNGSHAVLPLQCVHELVMQSITENNLSLLFNMIVSGKTPISTENAYAILQ